MALGPPTPAGLRAFRTADGRHPLFDGTGARLVGGRWNSPGRPLIYAAESYAGALLEVLAHAGLGRIPQTHAFIQIEIPASVAVESVASEDLPGWDAEDQIASRAFGDRWLLEVRTAILLVPSLVTAGIERNVLINPAHPGFGSIVASAPQEVRWDTRLFR